MFRIEVIHAMVPGDRTPALCGKSNSGTPPVTMLILALKWGFPLAAAYHWTIDK